MQRLKRVLRWRYRSPMGVRYPPQLAAMALTWAILGFAGVGFATTVFSGFAVGLIAEAAAHLWWQRRERRRDLANGYARRRDDA